PRHYSYRGRTYNRIEEFDKAVSDLTKAIELEPSYKPSHFYLGMAQRGAGNARAAIEAFTHYIKLKPADKDLAYYWRGLSRLDAKDYRGAVVDFTRLLELDKDDEEIYFYRGLAHYNLKHHREALADFDACIALEPNDPATYYNRALCHQWLGDFNLAAENFRKVLELDPNNEKARASLEMLEDLID
ncbi:MAG: tetratricopeptide repeat protein, partial [Selenomonadaceae bacterium]|nr:tetratricopeptide repeat protein [Selenomonadaceae bacterium]